MDKHPIAQERRTTDAIIDALAAADVRFVVGMPGGLTVPLWSALHEHPSIRAVQVREESLGSYMAEAHGRLTGRPLVVMGQGEWIAGNAGQAFIEALTGSSPMVILTEMSDGGAFSHHAPYQSGTADYGTWDALTALRAVMKRVMVSHHPAQAVQHTQLAVKHALTGDPGPTAVIFTRESLRGWVGPSSAPLIYPTWAYLDSGRAGVDRASLESVTAAILRAKRPVILAGNGVRVGQAAGQLERLASELDVPVVTTAAGKGVFPERDPLAGGVIGPFGWDSANALLGDADLVLIVGSRLSSSDTADGNRALLDPQRQVLIQLDIEPLHMNWTTPVDHVLVGDAGILMNEISTELAGRRPQSSFAGAARVASATDDGLATDPEEQNTPGGPLSPRVVIEALSDIVPAHTIVTCDAGENRLFMMQWFRSGGKGRYLQPASGGGMGYAVPAAMGAKLAYPGQPVLAVCGDGGFSMAIHGLISALERSLPIGVVVLNNRALGWVLHGSRHPVGAHLNDIDFAGVARALGCDGIRVDSVESLKGVLANLDQLTRPLVIDVPTSLATSFLDVSKKIG